jgi:hypothetical protein
MYLLLASKVRGWEGEKAREGQAAAAERSALILLHKAVSEEAGLVEVVVEEAGRVPSRRGNAKFGRECAKAEGAIEYQAEANRVATTTRR